MTTELGTRLGRRNTLAWAMVAGAVVLAVPTARAVRSANDGPTSLGAWAVVVTMTLFFVLGPLLLARGLFRIRVFVDEAALTRTYGDRVVHRLEFSRVTRVRVRREAYFLTITLWGDDPQGRSLVFPVSKAYVSDLEPLARRLDAELVRRPDLFVDEAERRRWADVRSGGR
ncbi:hypothetical protein [Nocardioides sp. Soil805]|uniref:hypothetical protein n=1 Tax=Nocardioides sp. Soil805 TaxID=1736416 RepID=UPI000702A14A|nr:hypothetical protein [Nocardioides sp. Soil805]KRF37537.1 hypothetical protein ASG94_09580 [Nocardioides sp. Soil805]